MLTDVMIEIGNAMLQMNLVKSFHHSVEIVSYKDNMKLPAYKNGSEFSYIGPDDEREFFTYIRKDGTVLFNYAGSVSSDLKIYDSTIPLKIVLFKSFEERNFDKIIDNFLKIGFIKNVKLLSLETDKQKILSTESSFNSLIDDKTFYITLNINYTKKFTLNNCEIDYCVDYKNPICK